MNELREHRKNQKDNVSVAEREREREGRGRSAVVRSGFEFQIMHIHARVDVGREILREIHPRACIHLPALPSSTLMINKDVTIRGTINKTKCGGKKQENVTHLRGRGARFCPALGTRSCLRAGGVVSLVPPRKPEVSSRKYILITAMGPSPLFRINRHQR